MSISLTVRRLQGDFVEKITARAEQWAGNAPLGARIEVPPELAWWYWNEFGTATKFAGAPEGLPGTVNLAPAGVGGRYEIKPVNAKMLAFPLNGQTVLRSMVLHPGIRPSRSVSKVLAQIIEELSAAVASAFRMGGADDPSVVSQAIVTTTENAKELIAESIGSNLKQERADGRLEGQNPGEVFSSNATVVDLSQ